MMYQIVSKMKLLKYSLKKLNKQVIKGVVTEAGKDRKALEQIQLALQVNPTDKNLQ